MRLHRCLNAMVFSIALILPSLTRAADDTPPRIATVNTAKVFREMLETKDLKQKMEADAKAMNDEKARRDADLQQAQKDRDLYNEGSAEYDKASRTLIEKAIATKVWTELRNLDLTREQKVQMRNLYNKINDAVEEIARKKKLDIVLVDQGIELPADNMEKMTIDQLHQLINQRSVMYNSKRLDISDEVLAAVDAKYKFRK
jgi:Skp family chaperone for outer membrane proteins